MKWHSILCVHQSRTAVNLPYQRPWSCRFISQGTVLQSHRACSPSLWTCAWTCPQLRLLTFTVVTDGACPLLPALTPPQRSPVYFHHQDSIIPYYLRLRDPYVIVVITFAGSSGTPSFSQIIVSFVEILWELHCWHPGCKQMTLFELLQFPIISFSILLECMYNRFNMCKCIIIGSINYTIFTEFIVKQNKLSYHINISRWLHTNAFFRCD